MTTDEKIVQVLGALQDGQKALQADVQKQGEKIEGLIDVQQKQGTQLEALQAGLNIEKLSPGAKEKDFAVKAYFRTT